MADTEIPATATNAVDAAPKVFISHAGEDRERFAKPFAARLRANGVDAWASFWEINPGDSIVDKIFNEGLKNCEVIVIVLSNNSIGKPWVREELNAGMVRRIEKRSKLIPIRLDGCEVPECLKHTCWQEIPDLRNFDKEFERILNAVFGMYDKPPIGERPAYVRPDVLKIGDLTRIDSVIFEVACRTALEQDNPLIAAEPLVAALKANPESPRSGLLTFEHQGCTAFQAITVDPNLTDAQLRHLIGDASQMLQDRRLERTDKAAVENPKLPLEGGEFAYEVRTSYFPHIKGHFPTFFTWSGTRTNGSRCRWSRGFVVTSGPW